MKKYIILLTMCLITFSLSSFNTQNETVDCFCANEFYSINCDRVAVGTYPVYYREAGGNNEIAQMFAQFSYQSCLNNGGSGLGWPFALNLIRHTYPNYF